MSKAVTAHYIGSNGAEVTNVNMQELVPKKPDNWSVGYIFRKFSFHNEIPCTIIINGTDSIRLLGYRGFEVGYDDPPIYSFKILEAGTVYEFIASY